MIVVKAISPVSISAHGETCDSSSHCNEVVMNIGAVGKVYSLRATSSVLLKAYDALRIA